jgi:hypothetical protein
MSAVIGLTFVAPALAADTSASSTEPAKSATVKTMRTHQILGEIVSIDQAGKTLTVKPGTSKSAKDMVFTAEGGAAAALADLKPGDHVKVSYQGGQGRLTAKTVAKNEHVAKK